MRIHSSTLRCALCAGLILVGASTAGHESAVDHVDRTLAMWVLDGTLYVSYHCQLTERAAMMQLDQADADGDGVVGDAEREAGDAAATARFGALLRIELAGAPLPLRPVAGVVRDPGLGQTYLFSASLPVDHVGAHGELIDGTADDYPGETRFIQQPAMPAGARAVTGAWDEHSDPEHANDPSEDHADHPAVVRIRFDLPR